MLFDGRPVTDNQASVSVAFIALLLSLSFRVIWCCGRHVTPAFLHHRLSFEVLLGKRVLVRIFFRFNSCRTLSLYFLLNSDSVPHLGGAAYVVFFSRINACSLFVTPEETFAPPRAAY